VVDRARQLVLAALVLGLAHRLVVELGGLLLGPQRCERARAVVERLPLVLRRQLGALADLRLVVLGLARRDGRDRRYGGLRHLWHGDAGLRLGGIGGRDVGRRRRRRAVASAVGGAIRAAHGVDHHAGDQHDDRREQRDDEAALGAGLRDIGDER